MLLFLISTCYEQFTCRLFDGDEFAEVTRSEVVIYSDFFRMIVSVLIALDFFSFIMPSG